MAVTGKFQADFESFYAAVQKAEVELRTLESGAAKVGPSLTRMANSLQGTSLIQQATLMTQAVEKVGGVSTLTDSQLRRVGATVTEAAEKMRRLGIEVPPGMQKIADAARQAAASTSLLDGAIGKLAAAATVGAIARLGSEVLQSAGRLQDFHERTEVSIEALQRYEVIAKQSGSTLEAVSSAVFQMGRRLAGDDRSAAEAVRALGLNLADLKAMRPEDAFNELGKAVATIPDPMKQSELGTKLFGRSVQEMLPVFKHLSDETGPYVTLTSQQVETLDLLGDTYERVKASMIPATVAYLDQKLNISGLVEAVQLLTGALSDLPKVQGEAAASLDRYNTSMAKAIEQRALLAPTLAEAQAREQVFVDAINAAKAAHEQASLATRKHREEIDAFQASAARATARLGIFGDQVWDLVPAQQGVTGSGEAVRNVLAGLDADGLIPVSRDLSGMIATMPSVIEGWSGFGEEAAQTRDYLGMVEGVLGNIQTQAAQVAVVGVRAFQAISTSLAEGDWLGAIVAGVSAVGGLFGRLFGPSEESAKVNKPRQAWIDAAGGLEVLNPKILEATGSLQLMQDVFDATTEAEYKAAIDAVTKALSDHQAALDAVAGAAEAALPTMADLAAAAGYETQAQLEKTRDDAIALYEYMRDAGTYSAQAIADAQAAALEAERAALGEAGVALAELEGQYQSLADSIADEAPEEVMGVIESATRAEMAVLEDQMEKQRAELESQATTAADTLEDELARIDPAAVQVQIEWVIPDINDSIQAGLGGATGGLVTSRGTAQHMAGGGLLRVPNVARSQAYERGAMGGTLVVPVMLDGREITRVVVPRLVEELRRGRVV